MIEPFFGGVTASVNPVSLLDLETSWKKTLNATAVEFRLDGLGDLAYEGLNAINLQEGRPLILSLHSKEQGGTRRISPDEQWNFWARIPYSVASKLKDRRSQFFVDWGADLMLYQRHSYKPLVFPWSKIGVSWHDFDRTPPELSGVLALLESSPAMGFIKLVTTANTLDDVNRVKALFSGRTDPRPLIAFLMGEVGRESRLQCLKWGSGATYGYVPGCPQTAPGQLSIVELLNDPSVQSALQSHS